MTVVYPKLSQFMDYRTFLIAHAQEQKRKNPQWSYGAWAKRLGLGGTASITRIIHGDRHPGPKLVEKLIAYFGFNQREIEYFKDLVQLDRLKTDPKMTTMLLEKLGKKYPHDTKSSIDEKSFQVLSNWYFLVIREMVKLEDFKPDASWIAERLSFKVTTRQVNHALQVLRDLELITTDSSGKTVQVEGKLQTSSESAAEAMKRYLEEMLENAKHYIRQATSDHSKVTAQTVTINSKNLEKAQNLIKEFQERFSELIEEKTGDQIFQLQLQFFPLTQTIQQKDFSPLRGDFSVTPFSFQTMVDPQPTEKLDPSLS